MRSFIPRAQMRRAGKNPRRDRNANEGTILTVRRTWAKTGVPVAPYTKEGKKGVPANRKSHSNASSPAWQNAEQEDPVSGAHAKEVTSGRGQCERPGLPAPGHRVPKFGK